MTQSIDPDRLQVLIAHPKDKSVLALQDGTLPSVSYKGFVDTQADKLCSFVKEELDLSFDVILLRSECPVLSDTVIGRRDLLIFDIPEDQLPCTSSFGKPWQWISKSKVRHMRVHPRIPDVLDYLENYSTCALNINSARLRPSSKPGWFDNAKKWTVDVLSNAGYAVCTVIQIRNSPASSMLQVMTQRGDKFYMKAVAPSDMNNEASMTLALGKIMPNVFKPPFKIDEKQQYILMKDYGPSMSDDDELAKTDPILFRKVLSAWAEIQMESISKQDEILQHGLPMIDREGLKRRVENMCKDPEWWSAQQEGMKEDDRTRYEESEYKQLYLRYIEGLCGKISEYRVPLTLVHGDLNAVNCILRWGDSGIAFIDFARTCWSFPFVDAAEFAFVHGAKREDLEFYLKFWLDYEPLDRLNELLRLIEKVCDVNAVLLSYELYANAEESARIQARENMQSPVCRAFSKGFNF